MTDNISRLSDVRDLFYDVDGRIISPGVFHSRFPLGRVRFRCNTVLGCQVSTEFVGINHQPDPDGPPLIYETIVITGAAIELSWWTGSAGAAARAHARAWALTVLGGAVVWHSANLLARARRWLRSWLR